MNKNTNRLLLGAVIVIVSLAVVAKLSCYSRFGTSVTWCQTTLQPFQAELDHQFAQLLVNGQSYRVELITTPESHARGLSDRTEIGSDGMLFVFPGDQVARFWMKDMLFDLDMVWLHKGEVVGITAQIPAPKPGESMAKLPIYTAPGMVDMVLEVPAGWAAQHGLELHDKIRLTR